MPRTKTKTRDRRALEKSLEREHGWKALIEEREQQLATTLDALSKATDQGETLIARLTTMQERAALAVRQGLYVKDLFSRLAQRYAGVQLDVQRMSIDQAAEFVKRELGAMEDGLADIAAQVEREFAQRNEEASGPQADHAGDAFAYAVVPDRKRWQGVDRWSL